jgi:hypothetical protein
VKVNNRITGLFEKVTYNTNYLILTIMAAALFIASPVFAQTYNFNSGDNQGWTVSFGAYGVGQLAAPVSAFWDDSANFSGDTTLGRPPVYGPLDAEDGSRGSITGHYGGAVVGDYMIASYASPVFSARELDSISAYFATAGTESGVTRNDAITARMWYKVGSTLYVGSFVDMTTTGTSGHNIPEWTLASVGVTAGHMVTQIGIDVWIESNVIFYDAFIDAVSAASSSLPPDADGDGYRSDVDCNDYDDTVHPGATELCDNKDNDCDNSTDENVTRQTTCGVGECAGNTGTETCTSGVWGNNTCNPRAGASAETCDNRDNDCDGSKDENLTRQTTCGVGECAGNTGNETCTAGQWMNNTCNPFAGSSAEACDNRDNDCDGSVDDNLTRITTCGTGSCSGNTGTETCSVGQWGNDTCDPFAGAVSETCDLSDNDCDGAVDEGFDADGDGVSVCGGDCDDNNFNIQTCNTPVSNDPVVVDDPVTGVTLEFPDVITGGDTTIDPIDCAEAPPGLILFATDPVCVRVETAAESSGLIRVCMSYDDTDCANENPNDPAGQEFCERSLTLWRCDAQGCTPLNTTHDVDLNEACAFTDHFSDIIQARGCVNSDGDLLCDLVDNCPDVFSFDQNDNDADDVGDVCDDCPNTPAGVPVDDAGCEIAGVNWKGDMNNDDIVDISDVIRVLRMALDLDTDQSCADINGDGVVDISDVIRTLRMALGLDVYQKCI